MAFTKIKNMLDRSNNILIISHQKPDGDACGSSLAMYHALKSLNKNVAIFLVDQPAEYFNFLPGVENISANRDVLYSNWDLVLILDSSNIDHTKVSLDELDAPIINIDHHFSNERFGDINHVDDTASSVCEIVYKFLSFAGLDINQSIATCLLCGILNDTNGFSNSATTVDSIEIASQLVSRGAKIHKITDHVVKNKTINGLRLWGEVLSRLSHDDDMEFAFTYIKDDEYHKYQISEEELDGIVNFLNVISNTSISALFRIGRHQTKISLRTTRDNVDVSKMAVSYGGGGHKKAAGFSLPYSLSDRSEDLCHFLKNGSN
jgi:phosphoesterase RecJ-like protein